MFTELLSDLTHVLQALLPLPFLPRFFVFWCCCCCCCWRCLCPGETPSKDPGGAGLPFRLLMLPLLPLLLAPPPPPQFCRLDAAEAFFAKHLKGRIQRNNLGKLQSCKQL